MFLTRRSPGPSRFMRALDQFSDGGDTEFGHQIGPMTFNGTLIDLEIGGDLLVQLTTANVSHYLPLARR